jgi:phospholipid/cholesterol/gamma-HCH transport system substrate-binding protein
LFDYTKTEIIAGAFVVLGLAMLAYLSISIGGLRILPGHHYRISARFSNVGDLKLRAPVKVAGVTIGKVDAIRLTDYFGEAVLAIEQGVALPKDTIASITTAGLLGDAYVSLSPGGAEQNLRDGDRITHTEPALNMSDLIGRYAFGAANGAPAEGGKTEGGDGTPPPSKAPAPASGKESRP